MVSVTIALSTIIVVIAAENVQEGRPPWYTWLVSLGVICGFAVFIAVFIWVGRRLPG